MREIRFRAWDTQFKRMLNNVAVCDGIVPHIGHHCEVMQFTGLKDKNGKEIYEGDIVRISCSCGHTDVGVVEYAYNSYRLKFRYSHRWDNDQNEFNNYDSDREIIGNIYENPELLKEGKDGAN